MLPSVLLKRFDVVPPVVEADVVEVVTEVTVLVMGPAPVSLRRHHNSVSSGTASSGNVTGKGIRRTICGSRCTSGDSTGSRAGSSAIGSCSCRVSGGCGTRSGADCSRC